MKKILVTDTLFNFKEHKDKLKQAGYEVVTKTLRTPQNNVFTLSLYFV